MILKKSSIALCFTFVFCVNISVSMAQKVESVIRGRVLDPFSKPISSATVTALNTETGISRSTATNHSGYYVFPSLPAGRYMVSATAAGFQSLRKITMSSSLRSDPNSRTNYIRR